jgi:nicotinamidase-related amidase
MSVLQRLSSRDAGLLVIDIQQKLIDLVVEGQRLVRNTRALIEAAKLLQIPVWATEQYPKGLGSTVAQLAELLPDRPAKTSFSCCAVPELLEQLLGRRLRHVTVVGLETHVCVAQTVLDLLNHGLVVQVPADAVSSRATLDWEFALRRLERAGAVISTTESVLFEWVENADASAFKAISHIVKQRTH